MINVKTEILRDVLVIHLVIQLFLLYYGSWFLSLSVVLGGVISSLNFYFMAKHSECMLALDSVAERRKRTVLAVFIRYGLLFALVLGVSYAGAVDFAGFLPALLSVQIAIFVRMLVGEPSNGRNRKHR